MKLVKANATGSAWLESVVGASHSRTGKCRFQAGGGTSSSPQFSLCPGYPLGMPAYQGVCGSLSTGEFGVF